MKISIVTITSNSNDSAEESVKPFYTLENATRHLYKEYINIKAANGNLDYDIDEASTPSDEHCDEFYMEFLKDNYWCHGVIHTMEIE
jgi:hypothetical protein